MKNNWDIVSDRLARVGYERMFDDTWDNADPIEKELWKEIALSMIKELWALYKMANG